ncbi:MAG: NADH-quinone oxidoreductase subunit A, partial [Sediminibacterium sp.]
WTGFFEVVMFVGFFLVGFIYILKKGALKWED